MADKESIEKLAQSVERLERIFGEKSTKHTVQGVLSQQQQQADYDIIMEAADPDGYGTASPQEVVEAQGRMNIRTYLADPQLSEIALKHNISTEQLAEALIKKGADKVVESRQKGANAFFNDLMGLVPPKPGDKTPGLTPLTPDQKARMKARAKQSQGTTDDMADLLAIVTEDPFFDS
jgi:hypothetical protein